MAVKQEWDASELLGMIHLCKLLHHWKSTLFESLITGERSILTLVLDPREKNLAMLDGSCAVLVGACLEHLKMHSATSVKDLPMYMAPVLPCTIDEFRGSETETFLKKRGIGYDVLVFLDDVEEIMELSAQSHVDPDFACRIDLIYVDGPPATTLAATPTAGSLGLHVSWGAFVLLEKLGLLVPSRVGPALFIGSIAHTDSQEGALREVLQLAMEAMLELTQQLDAKLEGTVWNRTDGDLVTAIEAIARGSPSVRGQLMVR
eukprot:TRINITY_DN46276_c0_g1_i1.p1 TRINITY_DN46276_c0_g1~~TRINITY_DN46276_c0_g1_i1.p1  ORF type:complete len:261 (+),score=43.08 TRINITY_DN46276_c0_g1_i1:164-946(+)